MQIYKKFKLQLPGARHEVCWRSLNIFFGKVLRWPTRKTPKVLFTLAINFSLLQGESTSSFIILMIQIPELYLVKHVLNPRVWSQSFVWSPVEWEKQTRFRAAKKKTLKVLSQIFCFCVYRIVTRLVNVLSPSSDERMRRKTFDDICYIWLWLSALSPPVDDIMKWG